MKTLILLFFVSFGQLCCAQGLSCLIKTGPPDLPKFIIRPDCMYLKEPDLYKRKALVLADINKEFDPIIKTEKDRVDSIALLKTELQAAGKDTTQISEALIQQEFIFKTQKDGKAFKIRELNNFMAPRIKLEHETTAFYSLPDYKGKKYLVKGSKNNAVVSFYPQSIRVARGCRIKVYPFHDYKASKTYGTSELKKSTKDLMPNVNSGSMVGDPTVFRAVSWKLICK